MFAFKAVQRFDAGIDILGAGADSLLADDEPIPVGIDLAVQVSFESTEIAQGRVLDLTATVRHPETREIVITQKWPYSPPQVVSPTFIEGHSGHQLFTLRLEFEAPIFGTYDVELRVNDSKPWYMPLYLTRRSG
jgi:hypothetical protein